MEDKNMSTQEAQENFIPGQQPALNMAHPNSSDSTSLLNGLQQSYQQQLDTANLLNYQLSNLNNYSSWPLIPIWSWPNPPSYALSSNNSTSSPYMMNGNSNHLMNGNSNNLMNGNSNHLMNVSSNLMEENSNSSMNLDPNYMMQCSNHELSRLGMNHRYSEPNLWSANHTPVREHSKKKPKDHIKRPPNAFILYRSDKYKEMSEEYRGVNSAQFSRDVAKLWEAENEHIKEEYRHRAEIIRHQHYLKYPNYKASPLVNRKNRKFLSKSQSFGSFKSSSEHVEHASILSSPKSEAGSLQSIEDIKLPRNNLVGLVQNEKQDIYQPNESSITFEAWKDFADISVMSGVSDANLLDSSWYLPFMDSTDIDDRRNKLKKIKCEPALSIPTFESLENLNFFPELNLNESTGYNNNTIKEAYSKKWTDLPE